MKKNMHGIKRIVSIILAGTLCFCCVFGFSACKEYRETVKKGITFSQEEKVEYLAETKTKGENALNNVVSKILNLTLSNNVSLNTSNKWKGIVKDVQDIFESAGVTEDNYLKIVTLINDNADDYSEAIYGLINGSSTGENTKKLKGLYATITATLGLEQTATIAFDIASYYYDFKYTEYMDSYEEKGWPHLLKDANKMYENRRILLEEIKIDNFIPLTQMCYFGFELFFGGAFENSLLSTFTDQEILQFLKFPNFSDINLTFSGWELTLSLLKPFVATTNFREKVFSKMEENGDLAVLSQKMTDVVKFINLLQRKLNLTDVNYLRQGKTQEYVRVVFENLSDSEWDKLESIFKFELKNDEYNVMAQNEYGSSYTEYLESLNEYSFSDVKQSVLSDGYNDIVKEYIKGLCPAFLYKV